MDRVTLLVVSARPSLMTRLHPAFAQSKEIRLVGVGTAGSQAVPMAVTLRPEVTLFDVEQRVESSGESALPIIALAAPGTRVLLCHHSSDDDFVVHALKLGVWGCVLRERPPEEFLKAIRAIHEGELWICRKILTRAFQKACCDAAHHQMMGSAAARLTGREREIVDWLSFGMMNKEIARKLGISDKTVKTHMQRIFKKLNMHRRVQIAVTHGAGDEKAA